MDMNWMSPITSLNTKRRQEVQSLVSGTETLDEIGAYLTMAPVSNWMLWIRRTNNRINAIVNDCRICHVQRTLCNGGRCSKSEASRHNFGWKVSFSICEAKFVYILRAQHKIHRLIILPQKMKISASARVDVRNTIDDGVFFGEQNTARATIITKKKTDTHTDRFYLRTVLTQRNGRVLAKRSLCVHVRVCVHGCASVSVK